MEIETFSLKFWIIKIIFLLQKELDCLLKIIDQLKCLESLSLILYDHLIIRQSRMLKKYLKNILNLIFGAVDEFFFYFMD